ncbi:MAG TPA: hypothetical protein DCP10_06905 [Bacteroidales bacterium]|nr:hypothetical protein [Bacteroidales bacterium]
MNDRLIFIVLIPLITGTLTLASKTMICGVIYGDFSTQYFMVKSTVTDDTLYFNTSYDSCHDARPICGDTSMIFVKPANSYAYFYECCEGQTYYTDCCRSYGCLTSSMIDEPRWFLLRIATSGKIELSIIRTIYNFPTPFQNHIDKPCFMIFGPFDTPTGACVAGLTDSTIVDCHDSYLAPDDDTATIPWGNTGEFYLLNVTSDNPYPLPAYLSIKTINYGQPGHGTLDCDMTIYCQILSLTANVSACDSNTNTSTLSGKVYFVHPPQTGQLVIWDNNTGYSANYNPPFTSPVNYSISGLPCDNQLHTVTAMFWDSASCYLSAQYQAPVLCPDATLSGSGGICENSGNAVPLSIYVNPNVQLPVTLQWSVNGYPQPAVTTSGPFPYTVMANQPGVYTLDTSYNVLCSGTTQGQAIVQTWSAPTPNLGPDISQCEGKEVTLDAGPGFTSYSWSTEEHTRFITVNKSDTYTVWVTDQHGCSGTDSVDVTFVPVPQPLLIKHR